MKGASAILISLATLAAGFSTTPSLLHTRAIPRTSRLAPSMVLGPQTVALGAAALSAATLEWEVSTNNGGLRRSFSYVKPQNLAGVLTKSVTSTMGFSPILVSLLLLTGILSPALSTLAGLSYLTGHLMYVALRPRLSSAEMRMKFCFVTNIVLIGLLGGLAFYNGLSGLRLLL